MQIKDDDVDFARRAQPIWDCPTGSVIEALRSFEDPEQPGVSLFTSGRRYKVLEMRPLRPAVVVLDDTGNKNVIDDEFIVNFRRVLGGVM